MSKIYIKLISTVLALVLSVAVVLASSYAWMVLSKNPVATGIQVTIGGGNTILVASNITESAEDGTVYNYPGHFADSLNFSQESAYDYLREIGGLNPVSTYNGVDWILPAYYSGSDPEVQGGQIPSGTLKDISEFTVDSELLNANLPADQNDEIHDGHYVYLDFWVVSPGGDYKLRVSTGVDESKGGSFVIDLMTPEATDEGYTLKETKGGAASAVRVGFLANDLLLVDDSMLKYQNSVYFDERFNCLKGMYQEPDTGTVYLEKNRFTIYEPNGDYHPFDDETDGKYVETKPLALVEGRIIEQRTRGNLTVQKRNTWRAGEVGTNASAIEQRFQAALYAHAGKNLSAEEAADMFYNQYLQGQISQYVQTGGFVGKNSNLYADLATFLGAVPAEVLAERTYDAAAEKEYGATDDVHIIELEKNVPQRIRMFIWLEGQDMDCVDSIGASQFAVNIELASGEL